MMSPLQAHLGESLTSLKFATKVCVKIRSRSIVALSTNNNLGSQHSHWYGEATESSVRLDCL